MKSEIQHINPSSQYSNGTWSFTQETYKSDFLAYFHLN